VPAQRVSEIDGDAARLPGHRVAPREERVAEIDACAQHALRHDGNLLLMRG
jgi:hypothetical protein